MNRIAFFNCFSVSESRERKQFSSELLSTMEAEAEADNRDSAVYSAKMAERSQRYEYMLERIQSVAKMGVALTAEERGLLSRALHHVLTAQLSSWRNLSAKEREEVTRRNNFSIRRALKSYIQLVEKEIYSICDQAQTLVENYVIPSCSSHEDRVYYLKMVGDCFLKYCYEFKTGAGKQAYVNRLRCIYEEADRIAKRNLSQFHPIRLSAAWSLSVFWKTTAGSPQRAIEIARGAFDDHHWLNPNSLKIMAILRERIDTWTRETNTNTGTSGSGGVSGGDGGEMAEQKPAKRQKR